MDPSHDHRLLDSYLRRPGRRRLARVVRALYAYAWNAALRVTGHREDAADVCQELFLSLLLRPPAPGSIHSARGYVVSRVMTISRTMRRSGRRRQRREQKVAAKCLEVERASLEDSLSLLEALEALPERLQVVVELTYFGNLAQHEVARILDVSPRTVAGDLQRAKGILRERLVGPAAVVVALLDSEPAAAAPPPELLRDLLRIVELGAALSPETATLAVGATTKKVAAAAVAAIFLLALVLVVAPRFRATTSAPSGAAIDRPSSAPGAPLLASIAPLPGEKQTPTPPPEAAAATEEAAPPEELYGSLTVRVVWDETGLPAAGVCIRAIPWNSPDLYIDDVEGVTNAEGVFIVERVFRGVGSVYLDRGISEYFRVQPDRDNEVLLRVPRGIDVRGLVVDGAGAPVAGARVWMSYGGNITVGREVAVAGPDGTFEVRAVGKGTYLGARAPGHAPSSIRLVQGEIGAGVEVRLVLSESGGTLSGVVLDPEGQPVTRAILMVGSEYPRPRVLEDGTPGRSPAAHFLRTDGEGRFFADTLSTGETEITVRAPGFAPFVTSVEVLQRAGEPPLEVVLERGGTIAGTVHDDEGEIAPARISVGDWQRFDSVKISTGPSGTFQLRGVPPGRIQIHADGHKDGALKGKATAWLDVKPGVEQRWDPVLSRNAQLAGSVVDARGAPLAGWTVQADEVANQVPRLYTARKCATREDGGFTLEDLSAMEYVLSVTEPGGKFPSLWIDPAVPGLEELHIVVPDGARASAFVVGALLDVNGDPCGAVLLSMFQSNSRLAYDVDAYNNFHLLSQETGGFKLGPLPPGLYRLEVQAKGQRPIEVGERELVPDGVLDLGALRLADH